MIDHQLNLFQFNRKLIQYNQVKPINDICYHPSVRTIRDIKAIAKCYCSTHQSIHEDVTRNHNDFVLGLHSVAVFGECGDDIWGVKENK